MAYLPQSILEAVVYALKGSSESLERYIERTGVVADSGELEEQLLGENIERCPACETWCECSELIPVNKDKPDGFCTYCRF